MFDDIVSNKYLIIALIIALIVVLYLYYRKKSCAVEGMKNLDLAPVGSSYELDYGQIPDKKMKRKKKKYIKQKNELSDSDDSSTESPKPLDPRPDLGNCVPCVCPGDKGYKRNRHKY